MDSKHKALLQHHKTFLSHNIVWSDTLAQTFKAQGILSDFMIKDIEECTSRVDKVKKFLEILPLKGTNNFGKLLDVLQTTGHVFIADFLREDDEQAQKIFDMADMYKDLPFVKRALNDGEKKQVEVYITEKIESQVLKILWKRDNKEKDKALESKMKQIEQAYEYEQKHEEQSKKKADTIAKLEQEIHAAMDDKGELKAKLAALSGFHQEQEKKHREALQMQMKYANANDKACQRANERIQMMENVLRSIKDKLDLVVKLHKEHHLPIPGSEREADVKEMIKAQGDFFFLNEDVDFFIRKFRSLVEIKNEHEKLKEERDYILIQFGVDMDVVHSKKTSDGTVEAEDAAEKPSLTEAYKAFAVRNEDTMQLIRDELEKAEGLLEENKAKVEDLSNQKDAKDNKFQMGASTWQSAIMNVMRNQNNDLKTDARKKETLMNMQEAEISKLKKRIIELEQSAAANAMKTRLAVHDLKDSVDGKLSGAATPEVNGFGHGHSTPSKPVKVKNLPPLKRDIQSSSHKINITGTVNITGDAGIPREKRGAPPVVVMTRHFQTDQEVKATHPKMSTYSMGPIASGIGPSSNRSSGNSSMGNGMGELKAMNKLQSRTFHTDRPNLKKERTKLK